MYDKGIYFLMPLYLPTFGRIAYFFHFFPEMPLYILYVKKVINI